MVEGDQTRPDIPSLLVSAPHYWRAARKEGT
jgi:hypothetical protein